MENLQIVTDCAKYLYLKYKFHGNSPLGRVSTTSNANEITEPTFYAK
jgi:hypothetical protein